MQLSPSGGRQRSSRLPDPTGETLHRAAPLIVTSRVHNSSMVCGVVFDSVVSFTDGMCRGEVWRDEQSRGTC